MEMIEGGRPDAVESACIAMSMGLGVHALGAFMNLWNPIRQAAVLVWADAGIGCASYTYFITGN